AAASDRSRRPLSHRVRARWCAWAFRRLSWRLLDLTEQPRGGRDTGQIYRESVNRPPQLEREPDANPMELFGQGRAGGNTMLRHIAQAAALALALAPSVLTTTKAAARPVVEVAFVLDTTGSMGPLIEGAKRKIWSIATAIIDCSPEADIRMGLVAYRDI